jgi:hypothetical protein
MSWNRCCFKKNHVSYVLQINTNIKFTIKYTPFSTQHVLLHVLYLLVPPQWTVSTQRLHLSINIHRSKTEINIAIYKPEWYSQERRQHLLLEFMMNLKRFLSHNTLLVPPYLKDWKIINIVSFMFNVEIVFIKKKHFTCQVLSHDLLCFRPMAALLTFGEHSFVKTMMFTVTAPIIYFFFFFFFIKTISTLNINETILIIFQSFKYCLTSSVLWLRKRFKFIINSNNRCCLLSWEYHSGL